MTLVGYTGDVLDVGEDEQGPWALIKVVSHDMQLEGVQEVRRGIQQLSILISKMRQKQNPKSFM